MRFKECDTCGGKGFIYNKPCLKCSGEGALIPSEPNIILDYDIELLESSYEDDYEDDY